MLGKIKQNIKDQHLDEVKIKPGKNPESEFLSGKLEEGRIHTMPAKFLKTKSVQKKSSKKLLLIIILVVLLAAVATAAIMFLTFSKDESSVPAKQVVDESNELEDFAKNQTESITDEKSELTEENDTDSDLLNKKQGDESDKKIDLDEKSHVLISEIIGSSLDSDHDGLTDEEEQIYDTNPSKPDTDEDAYLDGEEVKNGFNPVIADAKLSVSNLVNTYSNPVYDYSILYPAKWLAQAVDQTNMEVMFASSAGEFVEVIAQENLAELSSYDWYLSQFSDASGEIETITVNERDAVQSADGMNIYLADGDMVYILAYNIGLKSSADFKTTFKMMINSFQIK